jgi:hypothetical protein
VEPDIRRLQRLGPVHLDQSPGTVPGQERQYGGVPFGGPDGPRAGSEDGGPRHYVHGEGACRAYPEGLLAQSVAHKRFDVGACETRFIHLFATPVARLVAVETGSDNVLPTVAAAIFQACKCSAVH